MNFSEHTFHIPVMGLGYTIDTPIKVARFGITSVVSIIQDSLVEEMRSHYCTLTGREYSHIPIEDIDHRAKRITAYLDLMQEIVNDQMNDLKVEGFFNGNDIVKYFELLPEDSSLKKLYKEMDSLDEKSAKEFLQHSLREKIVAGSIDVNIMTKLDNANYDENNELLPVEYCDAMAALRGYANSKLDSSIVLSAGLNPRLFAYMEKFPDFFPDKNGYIKKRTILKVSDYRSALIQGKFLAKKGIWISEFRVESGLNCGGHAFPTAGYLMGPILEEFKLNRQDLISQLYTLCNKSLEERGLPGLKSIPNTRITVQGGIGTQKEDKFLREYYHLDGTGWGSPFLLVPEATTVDSETLDQLVKAKKEDYYLSHSSPLGIPFNNFRKSTSEKLRLEKIEKNRSGFACHFSHLVSNTEFTEKPICTASRDYQRLKLKSMAKENKVQDDAGLTVDDIQEKDCLCTGLATSAFIKNDLPRINKFNTVSICPGPNLAYFSSVFSLDQMIGHIYGRVSNLNILNRSHMFINELNMYVDYLKDEIQKNADSLNNNRAKYFSSFKENLLNGIDYYQQLVPNLNEEKEELKRHMLDELENIKDAISNFGSTENWKLVMAVS